MVRFSRVCSLTGLLALGSVATAADLLPPAPVSIGGISVQAQPQVVLSATQQLTIDKARARAGWQLTATVAGGNVQHGGSSFSIPASVHFTSIQGLNNASTVGISISTDGSTITSGPYSGNRSYQAAFHARLTVPALPRAGAYAGTLSFIITEY